MIHALVAGLDPSLVLKVTGLLLAGAGLVRLLHRVSPSARHFVWAATLGGTLLLALSAPFAPRIPLVMPWLPEALVAPAPAPASVASRAAGTVVEIARPSPALVASGAIPPIPGGHASAAAGIPPLLVVWLLGTAIVLGRFAIGRVGLARIERHAIALADPGWQRALERAAALGGITHRVRLARSASVGAPVTWGVRRPIIVLPLDAESWPETQRRDVLLHELAHVDRRDAATQLVALAASALYWFHPWVWMAARRLRAEGERACDDRVLAAGSSPAEYATLLLDVARSARSMRLAGAVSIGMARVSSLEGRLLAVLDESAPRGRAPRRIVAAIGTALAALVVALAVATPAARSAPVRAARPVTAATTTTTTATTAVTVSSPPTTPARHAASSTADAETPTASTAGADTPAIAAGFDDEGGDASEFERSVPAAPGERLTLVLPTGSTVQVSGWDESRARVRGRLRGSDWRDERFEVERRGGGVQVRSRYSSGFGSHSSSDELDIRVPRRFDLFLDSAGGGLTVTGLAGSLSGHTGGGELTLDHVTGRADLTTGGGDISVSESDLTGHVTTGGGAVKFSHVRGGLRGSSGSGPVIYDEPGEGEDATGDLSDVHVDHTGTVRHDRDRVGRTGVTHISRAGGDVDLDEAPAGAVISTGGGAVTVGRAGGAVSVRTGGGDIEVGPVAGSIDAATGAGDVHLMLSRSRAEQSVEVRSGTGRVVIELPADYDGTLDLETSYTRDHRATTIALPSAWSRHRETIMDWDDREGTPRRYVRASGTAGGGKGRVRVKTVNGDIVIQRGRE